jgi:hypothetical protein
VAYLLSSRCREESHEDRVIVKIAAALFSGVAPAVARIRSKRRPLPRHEAQAQDAGGHSHSEVTNWRKASRLELQLSRAARLTGREC